MTRITLFAFVIFSALVASQSSEFIKNEELNEISAAIKDSQIDSRINLLKPVLNMIESIMNETKKILKGIVKKIENLVNSVKEKLEKLSEATWRKLNGIVEGIENKFKALAEKSKKARDCVNIYIPQMKNSLKDYRYYSGLCVRGSYERVKRIADTVEEHIDKIYDHIDAMNDMVSECMETNGNILAAAKCLWDQAREFRTNIYQMIGNVKDLVVDATKEAGSSVIDGTKCLVDSSVMVERDIVTATKALNACVKEDPLLSASDKLLLE